MRYLLTSLTMLLTACSQQAPTPKETPDSGASAAASAPTAAAKTDAAPNVAELPEVTLTSTGIILVGAVEGRGTATILEFGKDRKTVLDVMAADFPAPKLSKNAECGAGSMAFAEYGPLTLNFLNGKMVGWRAEQGANVVTSDGIRPGITIGDLKRERSVKMSGGTLEGEFEYDHADGNTIGGFANGAGDAAVVGSLHAGTNCFFR